MRGTVSDMRFCILNMSCLQWWSMSSMVLRGLDRRLVCIFCAPCATLSVSSFLKLHWDSALARMAIEGRKVVVIGKWSYPSMSLLTSQAAIRAVVEGVASVKSRVEGWFLSFSLVGTPGTLRNCSVPSSIVSTSCSAPASGLSTALPPHSGWCRLKSPTIRCSPCCKTTFRNVLGIGEFYSDVVKVGGIGL